MLRRTSRIRKRKNPTKLAELVHSKHLTQMMLAEKANVSQANISRYMDGRKPAADRAVQIARALGTTVEQIWGAAK